MGAVEEWDKLEAPCKLNKVIIPTLELLQAAIK
ncbi:hypothetical protein COLO4_24801 [Corchorus olitorius]|uniref:Uncharacterized protein n=1 Tax=Corchorus olitorius TaxID=93759 RepID=A0A1R3I6J5_9ROSI|nr:hypothetical protein COLO4_24801 [Corchorus olitorius]